MSESIHISDYENPVYSPEMAELIAALEGQPVALDSETLLRLAEEKLDVPLHRDAAMLQRYQAFFAEVQANGRVHGMGLMGLQQNAVDGLTDVSRLEYLHATYPEIAQTPIERPLIVAGMPRSGTTHLLKLLSSEPALRTMKRWQTFQSFPTRAMLDGREADNRREYGAQRDQMIDILLPHQRAMFDVGADDSTEEIEVMAKGCYGVAPSFLGHVPRYDHAFYNTDQTDAYRFLYRYLQAIQWVDKERSGPRWLLKTPQHLGALTAVRNVFPDACMVFTHRDPASVFTSLVSMTGYILRISYRPISKARIIEKTLAMQHGLLRGLVRDIDAMTGPVEHVYFDQFLKNKAATVERIYRAAGLEFDDAARRRIAELEATATRNRLGKVVYDLEGDFGLKRDDIRREFAYYTDRFPVAIEETQE